MSKPLPGSDRKQKNGAHKTGPCNPSERLSVTVLVRSRNKAGFDERVKRLSEGERPRPLDRETFAREFGATREDIDAVKTFAKAHGLEVTSEDTARRTVVLSGTVKAFEDAFGVTLDQYDHAGGSYRGRVGPINVPDELSGIVEGVFGLDDRPQAQTHFRLRKAMPHATAATSFTPVQVADFYGFPAGAGAGACIGIVELGGGYTTSDLQTYFSGLGITMPTVVAVPVDGAQNAPTGSTNGPDTEVMLDIEVAGAVAPAATIAVYFGPNTDAGFLDAVTTAVHDATNKPSVVSISWGGPESEWTSQATSALDGALQAASVMGVTVCVATGDSGSTDGVGDGAQHADFPASSAYALACGGTSVSVQNGTLTNEVVWNDGSEGGATGGGISTIFALPAWQSGLAAALTSGSPEALKNRGIPDVAGNADPETGYNIRVDGTDTVVGGTSAVAPLWAGLIARLNALKGTPLGYLNAALYKLGTLRDVTQGNNGYYAAAKGWDACSGVGTPSAPGVTEL